MRQSSRLRIIGPAILACAALLAACAPGGSAAKKDEIVVLGFGGAYDEVLKANAAEFEKQTGVHVTILPHSGSDALVKARAKEADVMVTDPIWAFRGESEGLWEKVAGDNVNQLYKKAHLSEYSVVHDFGAYGIAYNPDKVQPAPTSWNDLWSSKYKGHVTLRSFKPDSIELLVLMAKLNGGSERDIDPGFTKMAQLSQNVHSWFGTHPQALELYRSEEATLGMWTDARTAWAKSEGANLKFAVPKEGAFPLVSVMTVVKGRPNTDAALKYVDFELGQQAQERMANDMGYFPANSSVKLAADVQQKMALNAGNIESVQMADWKYIVSVLDQWESRWEKQVVAGKPGAK